MTSSIHQAREALGHRLRDIRRNAGLTGVALTARAGWPSSSKVSKIEHGKQTPSEDDIRTWCRHAGAEEQISDLVATVRSIESMYVEWRRMLEVGTHHRQHASKIVEAQTRLMRWYEPLLIPGILHTAEYARAVMGRVIDFYRIPDDLEAGVATRMERQQILYRGGRRFHFVVAQQALHTTVGNAEIMIGQLDRLLAVTSLARVLFGVLPTGAEYRVPTNQFIIFDDRLVNIETISAELAVSQPREIALYAKAFNELSQQAIYGRAARRLISDVLENRRTEQPPECEPELPSGHE
ncbi:helix-turn-helix domain-containing protein [Actinocrispum wychmicini]|uniref:Helix-turn-helix protein n=1 Tax=Actinocrispum wychmicini TaxID=1213861 RepID=A0A4R2IRK4_9PSEU|nr:helix-turn-helix transcriptional regulator [Actinocrispum wychmicini]TCO47332.1 helix-turn-helix protein [Actinocrispum wychmicini]